MGSRHDAVWAGVDVGGRRKGFHLAAVDGRRHIVVTRAATAIDCVEVLRVWGASVVGVDAPPSWADAGERSRSGERSFARAGVCGIRFTPDEATATGRTDRYFEWVEHGLELWCALRAAAMTAVECFPTATWTAWLGPRGPRSRPAWTRSGIDALVAHGIGGLEVVRDQDARDAVAAALTARQWRRFPDTVRSFDGMVVPCLGTLDAGVAP